MDEAERLALEAITKDLGIELYDLGLLRCALTLRSWCNEHPNSPWQSNQRLEFLGDAVLDLVIGELLFRRFPDQDEGVLTPMRAALVSKNALAKVAQSWGLGQHLFVGEGDARSGARTRSATLSDALEAVIAALYLDAQNQTQDAITKVRAVVERLWGQDIEALAPDMRQDPRSDLQHTVQGEIRATPRYAYQAKGKHAVRCEVFVLANGTKTLLGVGQGRQRKSAGDAAAKDALQKRAWIALGE